VTGDRRPTTYSEFLTEWANRDNLAFGVRARTASRTTAVMSSVLSCIIFSTGEFFQVTLDLCDDLFPCRVLPNNNSFFLYPSIDILKIILIIR
jgi:hypothetical protein